MNVAEFIEDIGYKNHPFKHITDTSERLHQCGVIEASHVAGIDLKNPDQEITADMREAYNAEYSAFMNDPDNNPEAAKKVA